MSQTHTLPELTKEVVANSIVIYNAIAKQSGGNLEELQRLFTEDAIKNLGLTPEKAAQFAETLVRNAQQR